MERFFDAALSPLLINIATSTLNYLDGLEEYRIPFPDLSFGCPLIVSGRCSGNFSNGQKVTGSLADGTKFVINLNVQQTKGPLLHQVVGKQQIDMLTTLAWASGSDQLVHQAARISRDLSIPCEFTEMVVLPASEKKTSPGMQEKRITVQKSKASKRSLVHGLHLGFGNVIATENNTPLAWAEKNGLKGSDKDQGGLYCCNLSVLGDCNCCSCCGPDVGSTYRRTMDDLTIACTHCCAALVCFGCMECCSELCCK